HRCDEADPRPAQTHAAARRRPVAVLRRRARGSRSRMGCQRSGPHAAQPNGVRGRRQDDLHHELRVERHDPDGHGARRTPRRRGARDADVTRPLLAPRARLLDASDVREARRPQGRGQDDRAQVPPLRRLRGPRLLAAPHAQLGPGVRLHVEEHGNGETLLLHQGLGQGSWAWRYTAPMFALHFRTILLDTRGTGRSYVPDEPYGIAELAEDAADVLHGRGAHVVGFSMGGYVALTLALAHPELVRSLVLAGTGAGGPTRVP